jgi:hypothetical protein
MLGVENMIVGPPPEEMKIEPAKFVEGHCEYEFIDTDFLKKNTLHYPKGKNPFAIPREMVFYKENENQMQKTKILKSK